MTLDEEDDFHAEENLSALSGHVLVRKGDWKLVNPGGEWDEPSFELYNLSEDLAETRDLGQKRPE